MTHTHTHTHTRRETEKEREKEMGRIYHATNSRHVARIIVMHRQVLHERILARLAAIDRKSYDDKHRSLQNIHVRKQ